MLRLLKTNIMGKKISYSANTPRFWRMIGDSLLMFSTSTTAYGIFSDSHAIAITSLLVGTLGKFLTGFFSEATKEEGS